MKQVNMNFDPTKEESHYNPMYITVDSLPTEKPLESFSSVVIDFGEEPTSVIDKMKPLQELENLKMYIRQLEALILDFRVKMPLYTYLTIRDEYDKHFHITTERHGRV